MFHYFLCINNITLPKYYLSNLKRQREEERGAPSYAR